MDIYKTIIVFNPSIEYHRFYLIICLSITDPYPSFYQSNSLLLILLLILLLLLIILLHLLILILLLILLLLLLLLILLILLLIISDFCVVDSTSWRGAELGEGDWLGIGG